jgi:tetratricopeptide (TPR) repeat protein
VEPRWQPTWQVLAHLALLHGHYERAEEFAQRLLDAATEDARTSRFIGAESILGTLWLRRGDFERAERWFKQGFDVLSGSDHMYRDGMRVTSACGLGDINLHRAKPSLALIEYRKAWHIVQEYPRMVTRERASARALAGLAAAYAGLGQRQQAEKMLYQAVESLQKCADPKTSGADTSLPELYHAVATSYLRLDNRDKALDMLERAVQTGWRDVAWLESDLEFCALTDDGRFLQLLRWIRQQPEIKFEQLE